MADLNAGTVQNLQADTLAGRIDQEFVALWNSLKDTELPNDTPTVEDRRLMFVAIARGLLRYLHERRERIDTSEDRANGAGTEHRHHLEFDWE